MTTNPLLVPIDSLIDYPAIQPEHIEQAVDQLLALARQAVDTVSNDDSEPSWDNIVEPITDATSTSTSGRVNSLNAILSKLPISGCLTWATLHWATSGLGERARSSFP